VVVNTTSWLLYLQERDTASIVQEVSWVPGSIWMDAEISPPPRFHPWTTQPAASHYTDCTILAHNRQIHPNNNKINDDMFCAHIAVRTYNDTTTSLSLTTGKRSLKKQ